MEINLDCKIIEFWRWLKSVSNDLLNDPTNSSLIAQLDNRISQLGQFDWEIGPFESGGFFLAISPNLNPDRLAITQHIISLSPVCEGWSFLPSKPLKKGWKGIFKMKNDFGKDIVVDCSDWKYILYQFDERDFDMDIMIDELEGDLNTHNLAIDIALTGYLGEEEYMRLIKNVNIVTDFEEESRATSLRYIKKHIDSII